jgi:hypothetical protein
LSHIGCFIGCYYYGALAYADDIVLLCPSKVGMNKMLQICNNYANDHGLMFNITKSESMYIDKQNMSPNFCMNDQALPNVSNIKHLGHILDKNITGLLDVNHIIKQFYKSVNILMADFGCISSNVLQMLFMQYCSSLYGIALCDITAKSFENVEIAWRKSIRRILRISPSIVI